MSTSTYYAIVRINDLVAVYLGWNLREAADALWPGTVHGMADNATDARHKALAAAAQIREAAKAREAKDRAAVRDKLLGMTHGAKKRAARKANHG